MKLSNKAYDTLKWIVTRLIPELIIAIAGLALYLKFDATVICGVLGIVGTFIGGLIGVSTKNYYKEQEEKKEKWDSL